MFAKVFTATDSDNVLAVDGLDIFVKQCLTVMQAMLLNQKSIIIASCV
jgi:hypothetical protein